MYPKTDATKIKQFNKEVISMMRGSILSNGRDFYVLVRAELGEAKNANGTPIAKQALSVSVRELSSTIPPFTLLLP